MSTPFFSVVIPTYNAADFLKRSLQSVLDQTDQDFEILVVDNNSTDHTDEVINSLQNDKIRTFKVNNDGIIAVSRNVGINNARGEWVAFLDADDRWFPIKLAKTRDAIESNKDCILFCHDVYVYENGIKKNSVCKCGPSSNNMYKQLLLKGNALVTSATTVNKEILIATGGYSENKDYVTVEDYEYWLRLSIEGKFYFINEILGEYYLHKGNYSGKGDIHAEASIKVIADCLNNSNYCDQLKNKCLSRVYSVAGKTMLKSGNFFRANQYEKTALKFNPMNFKAWVFLLFGILKRRI